MTPRERLLAVYYGQQPDEVPVLADLSYWNAAHSGEKFIPSTGANFDRAVQLMELHRRTGALIHTNLGCYYTVSFDDSVRATSGVRGEEFFHRYETPVGTVEEVREWSPQTWSWPITHHMVQSAEDLKIIRYVFEHIRYGTDWDAFHQAEQLVGDLGVSLVQVPYTGLGFLISRYAGAERTILLAADEPDEFEQTITTINAAHEQVFRLMADGPSQVLFVSDNISSDLQSPPWFRKYSGEHYGTMARVAREHGKPLMSHIDGRLRGLLGLSAQLGISGADAVTPAPWGDLSPQECRDEAGPSFILSGGIPPDSFHPDVPLATFDEHVEAWLELSRDSSALIAAPGDQLPPDGDIERVTRLVQIAASWKY